MPHLVIPRCMNTKFGIPTSKNIGDMHRTRSGTDIQCDYYMPPKVTHLVCPSDANRIIYKYAADLLKNCMLGCKVICVGCINCSYSMARSIMFTGSKIKYRLPPKCMAESFTSTACISKGQKGLFNLMNICIHTHIFFPRSPFCSVLQVGSWMRNLLPAQVKKKYIYIYGI